MATVRLSKTSPKRLFGPASPAAEHAGDFSEGVGDASPAASVVCDDDVRNCSICFEDFLAGTAQSWECQSDCRHTFCVDCVRNVWKKGGKDGCPHPDGCSATFSDADLLSFGASVSDVAARAEERQKRSIESALASEGGNKLFRCPNPECANTVTVKRDDGPQRFECSCGWVPTCTVCGKLYHYHQTKCGDVARARTGWVKWLEGFSGTGGSGEPERKKRRGVDGCEVSRSSMDREGGEEAAAAIARAIVVAKEEAERERERLADEKYKEKHCRLCPLCSRVVQKMGGCGSMKCGRDYHGGQVQQGCGNDFNWEEAVPYKAAGVEEKLTDKERGGAKRGKVEEDAFQSAKANLRHPFVTCANCGVSNFAGARFQCVNCPDADFCASCARRCEHDPRHVIRMLEIPDFVWGRDQLIPTNTRVVVWSGGKKKSVHDGKTGTLESHIKAHGCMVKLDLHPSSIKVDQSRIQPVFGSEAELRSCLEGGHNRGDRGNRGNDGNRGNSGNRSNSGNRGNRSNSGNRGSRGNRGNRGNREAESWGRRRAAYWTEHRAAGAVPRAFSPVGVRDDARTTTRRNSAAVGPPSPRQTTATRATAERRQERQERQERHERQERQERQQLGRRWDLLDASLLDPT